MTLNPVTTHYEFLGVPGAVAISVGLPLLIVAFHGLANENYHLVGVDLQLDAVLASLDPRDIFLNPTTWAVYLAWFFGLAALGELLPGTNLVGMPLRDGTTLPYKVNGPYMVGTLVAVLGARFYATAGAMPELEWVYANIPSITGTTIVFSYLLSTLLYVFSFVPLRQPNGVKTKERVLAVGGNSGSVVYDWFIGRELNPRIGSWDLKLYCELRPGLLLWMVINLACLHRQWRTTGTTDSMWLVVLFQLFYVVDGVMNEEGLLSMMDIVTDGFGFMLVFGDLAWVPMAYLLQARYLVVEPIHLGYAACAAIVALNFAGYHVFHQLNLEKLLFRQGKLPHLKSIQTTRATKLLCDSWWAMLQHINYLGDWMMAWAWCLPTGTATPLTYFYVVYFGTLLVHRQQRDDAKCRDKYGAAWKEYTTKVPYRIIPYVY